MARVIGSNPIVGKTASFEEKTEGIGGGIAMARSTNLGFGKTVLFISLPFIL